MQTTLKDARRSYCFTLNNPESLPDFDYRLCRYAIYQEEIGENGNYHLQGYFELNRPARWQQCARLFGLEGAHFESRRGSPKQAIEYCKKRDETYLSGPYEHGEPNVSQGTRTDWTKIKDMVKNNASDVDLFEENPGLWIRSFRGISLAKQLYLPKVRPQPQVILLYGPPGTGKSQWILDNVPNAFWKQNDSNWFDGFTGQEDIVLDDFYGWMPYSSLLRLLDKYPLQVQSKGSQVSVYAKKIYISSNKLPQQWYEKIKEKVDLTALTRRFTRVMEFSEGFKFQEIDDIPTYFSTHY